jgi:hypothetical protein
VDLLNRKCGDGLSHLELARSYFGVVFGRGRGMGIWRYEPGEAVHFEPGAYLTLCVSVGIFRQMPSLTGLDVQEELRPHAQQAVTKR